jgi:hypothetical protein
MTLYQALIWPGLEVDDFPEPEMRQYTIFPWEPSHLVNGITIANLQYPGRLPRGKNMEDLRVRAQGSIGFQTSTNNPECTTGILLLDIPNSVSDYRYPVVNVATSWM